MPTLQFRGMSDDAFPGEGYAELISNGHRDEEGAWYPLEGSIRIRDTGLGNDVINLYEFVRRGSQRWLVVEQLADNADELEVLAYNPQANTLTLIATRRRSTARPGGSTFLTASGWLYILTPESPPIRWDGERVEAVGFNAPPAPPRAAASAEGFNQVDVAHVGNGATVYRDQENQRGVGPFPLDGEPQSFRVGYALTWLNELGQESPLSALAFANGSNRDEDTGGRSIVFVDVPPGPPSAVAGRLWRTPNILAVEEPQGADVYLIDEFTHGAGHQYIDHTPDFELNQALAVEDLGSPPPVPPTGAFWAGYLWLVDGEDRSRIRRSADLLHEQFPVRYWFTVGSSSSGEVVALAPVQRSMLVFKERGVFAFTSPEAPPRVISESHGTDAPHAVCVVPDAGVFYLDRHNGPSVVVGTLTDDQNTRIRVLPGIRRTWRRRVAGASLESARVLYDASRREVWWSVPEGGNRSNSLSLVYHLDTEGWSLREDWPVDSMLLTSSGHVVVGSRVGQPGFDVLTHGVPDRNGLGVPVELRIHTAWQETGTPAGYATAELVVDAMGRSEVQLATRANRRAVDIDQGSHPLVHPDADRGFWGDGLWSPTEEWTETDPARVPVDLFDRSRAYSYQLRIVGARLRLYYVVLRNREDDKRAPGIRREPPGGSLP